MKSDDDWSRFAFNQKLQLKGKGAQFLKQLMSKELPNENTSQMKKEDMVDLLVTSRVQAAQDEEASMAKARAFLCCCQERAPSGPVG
eukprot:10982731-Alexandrium_andersonii.AAC.1